MTPEPLVVTLRPHLPVDLRLTLPPLRHGRSDPTFAVTTDGAWWRALRTATGPATVRFGGPSGGAVTVHAWGPGRQWAVDAAPDAIGARDSLEGFEPGRHRLVRHLHAAMPGLRITAARPLFQAVVPIVIEHKVIGREARAAYRRLVRAWGEPAPGPVPLRLPPEPRDLARRESWEFHPLGIEGHRAASLRSIASRAAKLEEAATMALPRAYARLRALPAVGPWTAAELGLVGLGDADAVSAGDYHLSNTVAWALAGEARATDQRMLELLEPFAGHRGRVIRLLEAAGFTAPRFGPRSVLREVARH